MKSEQEIQEYIDNLIREKQRTLDIIKEEQSEVVLFMARNQIKTIDQQLNALVWVLDL